MKTKRPIRLPAVLACLAQAVAVKCEDRVIKFPAKSGIMLYTNTAGRELYCLAPQKRKTSPAAFNSAVLTHKRDVSAAMAIYERWHDFPAVSGSLTQSPRGFLFHAGRAVEIGYKSDKWVGYTRPYYHPWDYPPVVWVNKYERPDLVVLTGGKIRVTKEGITG